MLPPSRGTCNLCFEYELVMKGLKDNVHLLAEIENSDIEDNSNNECVLNSATCMRQASAQRVCSNNKKTMKRK